MARRNMEFENYFGGGVLLLVAFLLGSIANGIVFWLLSAIVGAINVPMSGALGTLALIISGVISTGVHLYVNGWVAWNVVGLKWKR